MNRGANDRQNEFPSGVKPLSVIKIKIKSDPMTEILNGDVLKNVMELQQKVEKQFG